MIRSTFQSFSERDLQAETAGRGTPGKNLLVITVPVCAAIFAGLFLLTRSWWIAGIPALLFCGLSGVSNLLFAARMHRLRMLIGRENSVEAIEVEAVSAEDVEHLGSNGPAYCFFSEDGQALLLVGQWMLEAKQFPSLKFRLLRMADTGEPIRIESQAEEFIPPTYSTRLRTTYNISPVTRLQATPQNLQATLDSALTDSKFKHKEK